WRFEHVGVGREYQRQHQNLLPHPITGNTFGNRPSAVKVNAAGDRRPAAVKVELRSTRAESRRHADGRKRRKASSKKQARRVGPGPFRLTSRRVAAKTSRWVTRV